MTERLEAVLQMFNGTPLFSTNDSHYENFSYPSDDLSEWSVYQDYYDYYSEEHGFHMHVSKVFTELDHIVFNILTPVLLFIGFGTNLALLVMSCRKAVVKFYYPSIYFTALSIINIIYLSIETNNHIYHYFGFYIPDVAWICKLRRFLLLCSVDSRYVFIFLLVLDRCISSLAGRPRCNTSRLGQRIQATAKAVCCETTARLITVLSVAVIASYNLWIWWALKDGVFNCNIVFDLKWRTAFSFTVQVLFLIFVVAGGIFLVVAHCQPRSNRFSLYSDVSVDESETEATGNSINIGETISTAQVQQKQHNPCLQEKMLLIVLCISMGFVVFEIFLISLQLTRISKHGLTFVNLFITYPITGLVVRIFQLANSIDIPFVYGTFLHRVLVREVKVMLDDVMSQLMRMRGRGSTSQTDRIALFEPKREERESLPYIYVQEFS